ncbi:MAG: translesion DNA synthesis-associated protein ImuA [Rhodoferax sp.]|nr:translesion DNA synthesis-associated protein ImuA [Rhodoferax sp.]
MVAPEDIHADVWHAHTLAQSALQVVPTGDALLDAQLPGGGWPVGALTELLQSDGVHSEWRLLLPALAHSGQGPVVLVGAPHVPFAPSLSAQGLGLHRLLSVGAQTAAQRLWATEQVLRCAEVDAVLAWLPQARSDQLRRLQMAAAEFHKLLFVMRPLQAHSEASPAVLRLQIAPSCNAGSDALDIQVLKRRGPLLDAPLHLRARGALLESLLAAARPQHRPLPARPRTPGSVRNFVHALDRTAARA